VRYDCLRVQFDRYVDLEKYHSQICSELGIGDDEMRCGRIRGEANTWHINILRPQDTWRQYGQSEFQTALQQYRASAQQFRLPVCIGLDERGEPVFQDFATAPHVMVGGETGAGKSVLVRSMLASLFELAPQNETEIVVCYCKVSADFAAFKDRPNLWQGRIVSDAEEAAEILSSFADEMACFVDSVVNDKPTLVNGNDGLQPVIIALAAKRSLDEGRPVKLAEIA